MRLFRIFENGIMREERTANWQETLLETQHDLQMDARDKLISVQEIVIPDPPVKERERYDEDDE